jgi:hypothetical protein
VSSRVTAGAPFTSLAPGTQACRRMLIGRPFNRKDCPVAVNVAVNRGPDKAALPIGHNAHAALDLLTRLT